MKSKLLFINEVALRMRRTEAQVRWMVHKGTAPPSAMIGGRRVFREDEVEKWIDAQFAREASTA